MAGSCSCQRCKPRKSEILSNFRISGSITGKALRVSSLSPLFFLRSKPVEGIPKCACGIGLNSSVFLPVRGRRGISSRSLTHKTSYQDGLLRVTNTGIRQTLKPSCDENNIPRLRRRKVLTSITSPTLAFRVAVSSRQGHDMYAEGQVVHGSSLWVQRCHVLGPKSFFCIGSKNHQSTTAEKKAFLDSDAQSTHKTKVLPHFKTFL